jgi:hypothetical protein
MSTDASTWASVFASYSACDITDIPGNIIFLQRLVIFHLRRQKLPRGANKNDGKIVSYQSFNSIRQEMNRQDSRTHLVRHLLREGNCRLTGHFPEDFGRKRIFCVNIHFASCMLHCSDRSHQNPPQLSKNAPERPLQEWIVLLYLLALY